MDVVQDWAAYLVDNHGNLPPYATQAYGAISTLKSWILPVVDQLSKKPDLATLALTLVIVLLSLKLLNMLVQTVLFWFRMAYRLAFWGGLVGLALWMYTRGPDGVADDIQYWYNTWNTEFEHFKDQERVARLMNQQNGNRGARARW